MNLGMSVCVLLAALFSSSLSLPSQTTSQNTEIDPRVSETLATPSEDSHTRQVRSVGSELSHDETEASNTLNQLLVKLLSRKAAESHPRSSLSSRASGLAPGHRIKDRDYLGWMDFGRRSAEEYEYAS
ncbi:cholecystokinin-like [Periophthalmus magnuspinnatus]|uniref:cholecystokinin-like n=1 Tax=Periophthalmus magnuspinnatus TaxID=409849 RepID=UPI00145AF6FD|nr:cholecystokinin-like [Periophthalmus magnuspinnatus]